MSEIEPKNILLKQLLDEVEDGVYFIDRKRRITFWSRGAEQLTGYSRAEAIGRRCSDNMLKHVDEQGRALCLGRCPLAATMEDSQMRESRVYLHHKDGHRVPVRARTTPLRDDSGEIVGGVELFSDATPQKDLVERLKSLEKLAMLDALTELPNRRFLDSTLDKRQGEFTRYGWPWGVLLIDIDHFKRFNDTYGHDVGDVVLRAVAKALAHSARVFDVVGRWGGEEFLVILSNVDSDGLAIVAERLRMVVETSSVDVDSQPKPLQVTISLGGALAQGELSVAQLLKVADQRLYQAKETGRNCAVVSELTAKVASG
jgi:diguanylate cyclase (GGDEF)-like protein/PAS domain S-box-containing protein